MIGITNHQTNNNSYEVKGLYFVFVPTGTGTYPAGEGATGGAAAYPLPRRWTHRAALELAERLLPGVCGHGVSVAPADAGGGGTLPVGHEPR